VVPLQGDCDRTLAGRSESVGGTGGCSEIGERSGSGAVKPSAGEKNLRSRIAVQTIKRTPALRNFFYDIARRILTLPPERGCQAAAGMEDRSFQNFAKSPRGQAVRALESALFWRF